MKKARPRWFGNVKRRCFDAPMRRFERLDMMDTMRGR